MKTRISWEDLNEILIEANYPDRFKDRAEPIMERTFSASVFLGEGTYKEIYFEGIHIGYGNMELAKPTVLQVESNLDTVEMHFTLNGMVSTESACFRDGIHFSPGSHNIFYCKNFEGIVEWSAELPIRFFEINMTPAFFKKYIPEGKGLFKVFKKAMKERDAAILSRHNYPITREMYSIIDEIMHCGRKGMFKRIFLESKVIALLLLQLEQISSEGFPEISRNLKKKDIEKMYTVKALLDTNFKNMSTLIDLAKKVGTNEYTPKRGFKELFGTSVYNYWKGQRLEAAKAMLYDEGLGVQEVSSRIGYKNPQHFTAAFKQQFGVVPSAIVRS